MSSVSSYEGSDKDLFLQQRNSFIEPSRHSYLRKTDLLDTLDSTRSRDTDTWSVAATIDDQESVISAHAPSIISTSNKLDKYDDDHSTLDGVTSHLQDVSLIEDDDEVIEEIKIDNKSLLRGMLQEDEEDKHSRSNAAEFGEDGARSATADFDHSSVSSDVVDDQISAPPQPQPSLFVHKSYQELLEENEILQSQLRNSLSTQKHQADMITNLRSLTNCDDEIYSKALSLTSSSNNYVEMEINTRSLTQKLTKLIEVTRDFVKQNCSDDVLGVEQHLLTNIIDKYLNSLPFGTENQDLLNTAYNDQIRRFHSTLGTNFAKWYRRQTVQSLSLNIATKEYLHAMRNQLTADMLSLIHNANMDVWNGIMDLCATLSLEIHGGDSDIIIQNIELGSKFEEDIMVVANEKQTTGENVVNLVINPLFIDEEENVLLPARVCI